MKPARIMTSFLLVATVVASPARADQCAWVTAKQAEAAVKALPVGSDYVELCEPCGDKRPSAPVRVTAVSAEKLATPSEAATHLVSVNGKPLKDLAYTFVRTDAAKSTYFNLAVQAGCAVSGVSPSIEVGAQAPSAIVRKLVTVMGTNDEWTGADVKLDVGDLAIFFASGEVKLGSWMGSRSAAGAVNSGREGIDIAEGTLVRKVGTGAAVAVGVSNFFFASPDAKGALKLKVHDKGYENNAGQLEVQTLVIPAAAYPTPVVVGEEGPTVQEAPMMAAQLTVQGTNDEWTSSTIKLERGDIVVVRAAGKVNDASADGIGSSNVFGLMMKVGTGAAQFVGSRKAFVAGADGVLKFRVNDTSFPDNKGAFTADVLVLRGRSLPDAVPVKAE
jgi:hypothetical protein